MTFVNSKYQAEYQVASDIIREAGINNITVVRKNVNQKRRPIYGQNNINEEVALPYSFSGVLFPIKLVEGIENVVGEFTGYFIINDTSINTDIILQVNDEVSYNTKKYIIKRIKELNPDGAFPIIFEIDLI